MCSSMAAERDHCNLCFPFLCNRVTVSLFQIDPVYVSVGGRGIACSYSSHVCVTSQLSSSLQIIALFTSPAFCIKIIIVIIASFQPTASLTWFPFLIFFSPLADTCHLYLLKLERHVIVRWSNALCFKHFRNNFCA